MQFKLVALLTLLTVSVNGAAIRRNSCTCGDHHYDADNIRSAITRGQKNRDKNPWARYPRQYHGGDVGVEFSRCTAPFIIEFPLVIVGTYVRGFPGPDRVVYDLAGDFCGCITHKGRAAHDTTFTKCTSYF